MVVVVAARVEVMGVDAEGYAEVVTGVVGVAYVAVARCGVCEKTDVLHAFAGTGLV